MKCHSHSEGTGSVRIIKGQESETTIDGPQAVPQS